MAGEQEPPAVDRLDVGPGRVGRAGPWLLLTVGVLTLAAALVLGVARGDSSADREPSAPSSSAPASDPGDIPATTGAPAPEVVREGPAIRTGVPADYVVYARSEDAVFRIELGSGVVVRSPSARPAADGRESLVATRGAVLAVGEDGTDALRIYADGQPEQRPGGDFDQANQILPAPGGRFWIVRGAGGPTSNVSPVGPDGVLGGSLDVLGTVSPGGRGELLMRYLDRSWRIDADLGQTAISGTVLGTGPEHLLVGDCDDDGCDQRRTDRDGGTARRVAPGPVPPEDALGQVSPDGRWVVRLSPAADGGVVTELVELGTAQVVARARGGTAAGAGGLGSASAWLPDSSGYLVIEDGELAVLEPGSTGPRSLGLELPSLLTLACSR